MCLPKPIVGFNLSNGLRSVNNRLLLGPAIEPPYFYYENVALAAKGVWGKISRFLFDIDPKFVDSKYFCTAARKRGYIHNLPLVNGSPLLPTPPKTIFDTFPFTKKWWSSWDPRWQFNCLQTCVSSAKLLERIRLALTNCEDPPPVRVQKYVLSTDLVFAWTMANPHHRDLKIKREAKRAPFEPKSKQKTLHIFVGAGRGVNHTYKLCL